VSGGTSSVEPAGIWVSSEGLAASVQSMVSHCVDREAHGVARLPSIGLEVLHGHACS
jgi:hypothetical protein